MLTLRGMLREFPSIVVFVLVAAAAAVVVSFVLLHRSCNNHGCLIDAGVEGRGFGAYGRTHNENDHHWTKL